MFRPITGGLLVAVEGIDGAGKTSVASLLAQWCGERGLGCVISKEPTGLKWGTELRTSAKSGRLTLERELELFVLDRKDHVTRSIQPALNEGNIVILDRYYWSTAAYQGARGADMDAIFECNESFAPRPDLVLLLDVNVDNGIDRISQRGDAPNLFESKAYLEICRELFLKIADSQNNVQLIDANCPMNITFPLALKAFRSAALRKMKLFSKHIEKEAENNAVDFFGGNDLAEDYHSVVA